MAAEGKYERPINLAELCQAIAERRVAATIRDGQYQVCAADVRRLGLSLGRGLSLGDADLALPSSTDIPSGLLHHPQESQLDFSA